MADLTQRAPPSTLATPPTLAALAALVGLALLLAITIAIIASVGLGGSWLRAAILLATVTTLSQWLFLVGWAAVTAALFALGVGSSPPRRRARLLAFLSGVIVPVGLVLLGGLLGHLWPQLRDTTGPFDRPLLTLPLVIYALALPWLLGRLARTPHSSVVTGQ